MAGVNALGGLRIICSGDIGGVGISLECDVDGDKGQAEIDAALDLLAGRLRRQKAVTELEAKRVALLANRQMLMDLPKSLAESRKIHAAEEMRLRAQWQTEDERAGRRSTGKMTPQRENALAQIAQNRQSDENANERTKGDLERDIPIMQMQIDRLQALIDGRDPDEAEPPPLAEAAE